MPGYFADRLSMYAPARPKKIVEQDKNGRTRRPAGRVVSYGAERRRSQTQIADETYVGMVIAGV